MHQFIPIVHISHIGGPVIASSLAFLRFFHVVVGFHITRIDDCDQLCDSVFPSLESAPIPGILLNLMGAIGTMLQAEVGISVECLAASPLTTSSLSTYNSTS